jgi:hypothetical protein
VSRGLSWAGGPHLGVIVVGATSGAVAVSGVVALLLVAGLCLVVVCTLLIVFVDRL